MPPTHNLYRHTLVPALTQMHQRTPAGERVLLTAASPVLLLLLGEAVQGAAAESDDLATEEAEAALHEATMEILAHLFMYGSFAATFFLIHHTYFSSSVHGSFQVGGDAHARACIRVQASTHMANIRTRTTRNTHSTTQHLNPYTQLTTHNP